MKLSGSNVGHFGANNTPYKAKAMSGVSVSGSKRGPEIATDMANGSTKPASHPKKLGVSGQMVDGPYGGTKPESGR